MGEQSGSEAGASHRSQDDEEEDDNLSEDLEDDNEKDEGMFLILFEERSHSFREAWQQRDPHCQIYYISDKAMSSKKIVRLAIN